MSTPSKAERRRLRKRVRRSTNTRVREHFGGSTKGVEKVKREFPGYQLASVAVAARRFFTHVDPQAELTGCSGRGSILRKACVRKGRFVGRDPDEVDYRQITLPTGEQLTALACGVAFFRFEGEPVFAWCWEGGGYRPSYVVHVYARPRALAERVLAAFQDFERAQSLFRGRLIRPTLNYSDEIAEAEVLRRDPLDWDDVILSADLRQRIERDVLGFFAAAEQLEQNGVDPRRGVLLHGPPGTGKSFLCGLLSSKLPGFTTILCSGEAIERPAALFKLASRYAPALIVFEDVDLVGGAREENGAKRVLGGLLNELDGVGARDRVYTVFTTNRLEVLEEALARRPGRVDLILETPLPDAGLRRRLIRRHARETAADLGDLAGVVQATEGCSPAFLRELVKNAVFVAIEAGELDEAGKACLREAHLWTALERLKGVDSARSARILGFAAAPDRA